MERLKVLGNKLAISASLPSETSPLNPVVEILGYHRVYIENHHGIGEYGCNRIMVNVSYGQICVAGNRLSLAEMTKSSLVITGIIENISIERRRR